MRLEESLRRTARDMPQKAALVSDGTRLTYREFDELSDGLASALRRRGVVPGERVIVQMETIWEAAVAIFGVLKAGAVFCPVNPAIREEALGAIIRDTGVRIALTQGKFADRYAQHDLLVVATRPAPRMPANVEMFEDWTAAHEGAAAERLSEKDLAMILHTSGSTGEAKGVAMSHASMDFVADAIARYLEHTAEDVVLCALPLTFNYGLYQLLVAVRTGATLVCQKSFAFPVDVLKTARAEGVTGLPLVPTMAAQLIALRELGDDPLPALRYLTNAAAALPPVHVERLLALFPRARLFSMYGLTECGRATYLEPAELHARSGSVGKALPGTRALIVDLAGTPVQAGETGELVLQGPHLMSGYWRNDAATRRALRRLRGYGGLWLFTGDLFRADGDGFLYFEGRRDDMLKVRGEKVAPRLVEAALCECPGVAEAVVVGRVDSLAGHLLHAVVVRGRADLSEVEVLRHCAKLLPPAMIPETVEFRDQLPKTASGKVARRLVA